MIHRNCDIYISPIWGALGDCEVSETVKANKRQAHQQRGGVIAFTGGTWQLPGWHFQGERQWANGPWETFLGAGQMHNVVAQVEIPTEVIHPIQPTVGQLKVVYKSS